MSKNRFVLWVIFIGFLVVQMLLVIAVPVRSLEDPVWTVVGSEGFTTGTASNIAFALNSSDEPYIFFADDANGNRATVMKWNGNSWELVGEAGFSSGSVANALCSLSMSFDGSDVPYVAYRDSGADDKATVMKWNGASWETVGSAGFSNGTVEYLFVAIDGLDTPYVAFQDGVSGNKASVMTYDGDSWEMVGPAGISDGSASFTTLDFDSSHNPYLAYKDGANSNQTTVHKYTAADGWQVLGEKAFSPGEVNFPVIQLDQLDVPYIAFADLFSGEDDELTVMQYSGSSWNIVGNAGFTEGVSFSMPWYVSLRFDSANKPYVAYAAQRIYVFYYDGLWQQLGILPLIDEYSDYSALDIASDGTVYAAFTNVASKATVMSFAVAATPTPTSTEAEPTPTEAEPTPTESAPEPTPTETPPTPTPTEETSTPTPIVEQEDNPPTGGSYAFPLVWVSLLTGVVLIMILGRKQHKQS